MHGPPHQACPLAGGARIGPPHYAWTPAPCMDPRTMQAPSPGRPSSDPHGMHGPRTVHAGLGLGLGLELGLGLGLGLGLALW